MSEVLEILTIGYEGRDLPDVIEALAGASVELLIDTRYRASSRKRGFSKTALSEALRHAGIVYEHVRELGTPPEMMKELRESGTYELEEYAAYLDRNMKNFTKQKN